MRSGRCKFAGPSAQCRVRSLKLLVAFCELDTQSTLTSECLEPQSAPTAPLIQCSVVPRQTDRNHVMHINFEMLGASVGTHGTAYSVLTRPAADRQRPCDAH